MKEDGGKLGSGGSFNNSTPMDKLGADHANFFSLSSRSSCDRYRRVLVFFLMRDGLIST